jgi:hypothetical protein
MTPKYRTSYLRSGFRFGSPQGTALEVQSHAKAPKCRNLTSGGSIRQDTHQRHFFQAQVAVAEDN